MIRVLSVNLYDKDIIQAISLIVHNCKNGSKNNALVSLTGAHGIVISKKDSLFNSILSNFYLNLTDGMPGVWIGRLKGASKMQRCYGPDFFKETIIRTRNEKINHFFCGGKEGVAEELKKVCEEKFNNYHVVGTFTPPFREMTDDELKELAKMINETNTNILWVGLSTPKQEIFAYRLSKFTKVNFICTIGAAFDFHTGRVKQAPKWVQKIGMEWFFRLLIEPKRLWRRYSEIVPLFIWYNFKEVIKGEFFSNNKLGGENNV